MRVWRISLSRFAEEAFSGDGGLQFAGRWNPVGTRVVYTSGSLALAALEFFVNWNRRKDADPLVAIAAEVPDAVRIREIDVRLPRDWRARSGPVSTRMVGHEWIESNASAVLSVPSVVVPEERNYLLNPAHRDFRKIRIGSARAFSFDPRLWK